MPQKEQKLQRQLPHIGAELHAELPQNSVPDAVPRNRKMSFRLYRLCVVKSSDPWVYGTRRAQAAAWRASVHGERI